LGCHRDSRLERPALKYRPIWTACADRGEMIENPDVVEPRIVGDPPDRPQLVCRGVLAAVLDSKTQRVSHSCLLYGSGLSANANLQRSGALTMR
jgi:hypothetical protein